MQRFKGSHRLTLPLVAGFCFHECMAHAGGLACVKYGTREGEPTLVRPSAAEAFVSGSISDASGLADVIISSRLQKEQRHENRFDVAVRVVLCV
jgi:hypothetical protein